MVGCYDVLAWRRRVFWGSTELYNSCNDVLLLCVSSSQNTMPMEAVLDSGPIVAVHISRRLHLGRLIYLLAKREDGDEALHMRHCSGLGDDKFIYIIRLVLPQIIW